MRSLYSCQNFNYVFSTGFESGAVKLSKINDNKYQISPISGLNMYTYGCNFYVGVQYGGSRTIGDRGFRRIVEDDYIGAIESKTVQVGYRYRCNLGTDGLILGISQ